jgi:hypothetical protein
MLDRYYTKINVKCQVNSQNIGNLTTDPPSLKLWRDKLHGWTRILDSPPKGSSLRYEMLDSAPPTAGKLRRINPPAGVKSSLGEKWPKTEDFRAKRTDFGTDKENLIIFSLFLAIGGQM